MSQDQAVEQAPEGSPDVVKKAKKVKIKAIRSIQVGGHIHEPGSIVEVTEDEAKEFCDRKFAGYMPFYGTKPESNAMLNEGAPDPLATKQIVRAKRV